jgi:hypothetical protein
LRCESSLHSPTHQSSIAFTRRMGSSLLMQGLWQKMRGMVSLGGGD